MFPEIDQLGIGKPKITAVPQHLKAYPHKPAPLLGEDNAKIYGELLGFDSAKLDELWACGIWSIPPLSAPKPSRSWPTPKQ